MSGDQRWQQQQQQYRQKLPQQEKSIAEKEKKTSVNKVFNAHQYHLWWSSNGRRQYESEVHELEYTNVVDCWT